MAFCKEVVWGVVSLGLILICFGCAVNSVRQPRSLSQGVAQASAPPSVNTIPSPALRIPGTPAPAAAAPGHKDISLVSGPPLPQQAAPSEPEAPAPQAAPVASPAGSLANLRRVCRQAAERFAGIDSYIARLRRREQVNGRDKPEEVLLFKFRKQPWSVYFKWLPGGAGQGREVVYVKGQHGNLIHSLLAAGDMPLAPAGKRIALAPDNVFVRSASRHAITEAGIGAAIELMGQKLALMEKGQAQGHLNYLGVMKRPEFENQLEAVEEVIPAAGEPQLPFGGRRLVFFDITQKLPVLIVTSDHKGHEVEYYCYDRLQFPVKLDNYDFDPDKLWLPPKR